VRFAFIRDHRAEFPVERLCEILKVSRSGYCAWSRRPPGPAALRRGELVGEIRLDDHSKNDAAPGGEPGAARSAESVKG
jgi:hypothetical protein